MKWVHYRCEIRKRDFNFNVTVSEAARWVFVGAAEQGQGSKQAARRGRVELWGLYCVSLVMSTRQNTSLRLRLRVGGRGMAAGARHATIANVRDQPARFQRGGHQSRVR